MKISGDIRQRGLGLFPAGFEGEVLHLVIDVWSKLQLPKSARLEPRITKLLARALRQRFNDEQRDGFVTVEDPDSDEDGKEISRTDIRVFPPKQHLGGFVLESKRLNTPKSNASEYVGAGGMCFITGKYSRGLPCGAMLGYVMDANISRAYDAVIKAVKDKRVALLLAVDGDYQSSPSLKNDKWNGETRHLLPDGRFTIYHLLLPVRWQAGGREV
jgi:hypothetical protein